MSGGTRSFEFGRRLVEAGHSVDMITSWREGSRRSCWFTTEEAGMRVHWLPVRYSNCMGYRERIRAFLRFAWGAARRAASLSGDVLFATSTPLTIALPAVYASRRMRIPMVFEVRDLWPEVPIALGALRNPLLVWLARRLEDFAYDNANRLVALAPGMKQSMVESGVSADRIAVIPNGADLHLFGPNFRNAESQVQESLPLRDRPFILYPGAVGKANGVDYLVDIAIQLRKLGADLCIVVIGDGSERDKVREKAREAGVHNRNFFLMDPVPKVELVSWFQSASMVAITYTGPRVLWKDSVCNKFFDAIASGKPICHNFLGWAQRITYSRNTSIYLTPEDPAKAARQLVAKIQSPEWLEQAGQKNRELAESRFSRAELATEFEDVLYLAVREATTNGPGEIFED